MMLNCVSLVMNERQRLSGGVYDEDGVCVCEKAEGKQTSQTHQRRRKSERREERFGYRTFLQTHVYHARLAQLQEEVLVFLILLIVNNFHVNYFAARGTITGWGEEEGGGGVEATGTERGRREWGERERRRRKSEKKVNL